MNDTFLPTLEDKVKFAEKLGLFAVILDGGYIQLSNEHAERCVNASIGTERFMNDLCLAAFNIGYKSGVRSTMEI